MTSKGNGNASEAQFCPYCGAAYVEKYGPDGEYQCLYCGQVFDEREVITDVARAFGLRLDFRASDAPQTYVERPDLTYGVPGNNSL